MKKLISALALGAALVVPALALAQTPTTGLLNVYVQVLNDPSYNYQPSQFNVSVSGQNPSITNFGGSLSGTLVTLSPGSYNVVVTNGAQFNYIASYSAGCNNTIAAGQSQTCVVTMTRTTHNPPVYPYPGGYTNPLTCRTETPTVALGQSARFVAQGGAGGTYNWYAASQNFPNIGPVLTTTFNSSGTHTVQVVNANQTATCTITVTNSYYPQPTPTPNYPYYPTLQSQVYPRFPNTGFEPITSAQLAFATVLLAGAAIALYPYGRKAFALAVR